MTTYPVTVRELIIREIKELFEAYTFENVTSPTIYRGRRVFDPDTEPPPLITILPRVEESQRTQFGMDEKTMAVEIVCLEPLGTRNASELAEAILGELQLCMFGKQDTENGAAVKKGGLTRDYADDCYYRTGGVEVYPDELGQHILHTGITVFIQYQTNAGDPYSH